jgi:hypothetical protein
MKKAKKKLDKIRVCIKGSNKYDDDKVYQVYRIIFNKILEKRFKREGIA